MLSPRFEVIDERDSFLIKYDKKREMTECSGCIMGMGRSMQKRSKQAYDLTIHEHTLTAVPKKERKTEQKEKRSAWYYAGYFGEIGFVIAIPIAGGAFIGSYLDQRWSTYPKTTLALLFAGVLLSIIQFIRIIREIIQTKDLQS